MYKGFDLNGYDTAYGCTYGQNRNDIEAFDQAFEYYILLVPEFPRHVYNLFLSDKTGEIICSE